MNSDIRIKADFNDDKDMVMVDDIIQKEKLDTISDTYQHTHPKYGNIRYFFSCFRDSVDYQGHLLTKTFFSESGSIGLSVFTRLEELLGEPTFQTAYKKDFTEYLEYLNRSLKDITGIDHDVFNTSNIEDIFKNCTNERGDKILT